MTLRRSQHRESSYMPDYNQSIGEKEHLDRYYPTRKYSYKNHESESRFVSRTPIEKVDLREDVYIDRVSTDRFSQGDDMEGVKFSFNRELSQDHSKLKDISNVSHQREKAHLVGSIKRNATVKRLNSQESKEAFYEQLDNVRLSKLTELNEKLNRALNKQNIPSNPNPNSSARIGFESKDKNKMGNSESYDKILTQSIIEDTLERKQLEQIREDEEEVSRPNPVPYLQRLFGHLDVNKVGKISKTNCRVNGISQECKFIFGTIFTKIFLKNLVCNKRQFTKLCLNVLKQLNSTQVYELLKDPPAEQSSSHNMLSSLAESQIQQVSSRATSQRRALSSRRGSQSISEQTLNEHKRSLMELSDLTRKVSTVILSQQVSEQFSMREEGSLRFQQLIKFI